MCTTWRRGPNDIRGGRIVINLRQLKDVELVDRNQGSLHIKHIQRLLFEIEDKTRQMINEVDFGDTERD